MVLGWGRGFRVARVGMVLFLSPGGLSALSVQQRLLPPLSRADGSLTAYSSPGGAVEAYFCTCTCTCSYTYTCPPSRHTLSRGLFVLASAPLPARGLLLGANLFFLVIDTLCALRAAAPGDHPLSDAGGFSRSLCRAVVGTFDGSRQAARSPF